MEIYHLDQWGAICDIFRGRDLLARAVCRQLGFPYGNGINPLRINPERFDSDAEDDEYSNSYNYVEEAEEPQERFWLSDVQCTGVEDRVEECNLGLGFRRRLLPCRGANPRFTVACRTFPIVEALEAVTTPGAGEPPANLISCNVYPISLSVEQVQIRAVTVESHAADIAELQWKYSVKFACSMMLTNRLASRGGRRAAGK